MLDILLFRTDRGGNPDLVRETLRRRGQDVTLVDRVIELDTEWRRARGDLDDKSAALNQLNKQIGAKKKAKEECADLLAQQPAYKSEIAALTELVERLEKQVNEILREMGNIVHESVPVSMNEDDNGLVKLHGEPKQIPDGRSHRDLIYMIDGADFERGSEVSGHSGFFFKGIGVQLNLALINYGIQFLVSKGFTPLQPPYFINRDVMGECAQLSQFDEELYKVETGHESDTKYLIATSEQPIAAFHRKEWIDPKDLPLKYAGWSSCFRKEAGHGKDASGLYRVHQFDKIEQFVITKPEDSWAMHEEMLAIAEEFYQSLGFSYRVVSIVSGALNNAAAKKLDLEAWFPIYKEYKELVSCSNCTDYQSRRLGIRIQAPGGTEKQYVHMLNCTLTATTRTICCILENYQTPEGIVVPEVLRPFILGSPAIIPYVREPPKEKASKKK